MNFTVSQRIKGGFFLTCAFLLVIAGVGVWGLMRVKGDLILVADEASPMVTQGAEVMAGLLQSNRELSRHFNTRQEDVASSARERFTAADNRYQRAEKALQEVLADHEALRDGFAGVNESAMQYLQTAPEIFALHDAELAAEKKARKARRTLEDLADDLGSNLQDLIDSGRGNQRSIAARLEKQISEAVVTAIDVLSMRNLSGVNISIRDLDALASSIQARQNELRAAGGDADLIDQITEFRALISGANSLPMHFKTQLEQADAAAKAFTRAEEQLSATLSGLEEQLNEVQAFKNDVTESAKQAVSVSQYILVVVVVVGFVFATLVATWVVRSINKPLEDTVRVIERVANGDMTVTVPVDRHDEFGQLAQSVNGLTSQLQRMLQQISETALALASAAEETSSISSSTHQAISHQRGQTEQVVVSMTEMTATVQDVARSAANTLGQVSGAKDETQSGRAVVLQSIEAINRLAKEVQESVAVINRLDNYSAQIGTVLDVIRGIAEQTNLLALNAAIEAARAGEQGRGFAVVADEVRTLASRTQSSTQEIQQMIERLQTGARDAVQVMARSQREAESAVAQTSRAGESLERITHSMNVINDMSMHIASAAEQQSAVTQEIHQNMTSISDVSEQTADGAAQNLTASQELARLASTLQGLVQQFKV